MTEFTYILEVFADLRLSRSEKDALEKVIESKSFDEQQLSFSGVNCLTLQDNRLPQKTLINSLVVWKMCEQAPNPKKLKSLSGPMPFSVPEKIVEML